MKQSVFNLNTLKAHPERNAFDLSHNDVFSCAPGMLLPISCTEVLPNEHYEINPQIFLRTMPLNSAAFVRMRQHVEFFFVPMRVLCRQFNQFVVGTKYPISSISTLNDFSSSLPNILLSDIASIYNQGTASDGLGIPSRYGFLRLFDLLGYGFSSSREISSSSYPLNYKNGDIEQVSPQLSIFRLACYQKIYQDYYRNPYWESADASYFNFDDKFGVRLTTTADSARLKNLFSLRYRNWSKDFFTSVQPHFQGAPFVTSNVNMSDFILDRNFSAGRNFTPDTIITGASTSIPKSSNDVIHVAALTASNSSSGSTAIPVHNIRAAFALDKLYRLQQQAGNGSYGEQIRNRFGFGGVHDDWKAQYIGGSSAPISIGEVITTANTVSASGDPAGITGDIYGKASSVNDGKFVFDTKEHGIIMGIFSVTPDADYNSTQIDPHNFKLKFEQFFQPEFERLGHQPLNSFFLSCLVPWKSDVLESNNKLWLQRVLGFQNRYLEYKTGIDRVHGQFCSGGTLSAWTAPRNSGILTEASPNYNLYSLKVSPKMLNSICSVSFDGTDKTDPIMVDSHVSIKAIRPMSVSDEPLL